MRIFTCKMCGGKLEIIAGDSVCTCDSCGTKQTLPRLDSERKVNLYDRASHFRRNNEFDKAMGIYEQILNEDNTDSEAYWSLVLCNYGIVYVEDPVTHRRIPTINRTQYTSIFADENYKAALQYATGEQRVVYEQEAKTIDEIQKRILAISEQEEAFDVFICYKEETPDGKRTRDSVLANDLYHQLTQEGFKVFFARITLEDKLGREYEPYIFAALNSAKVMVVLGTCPEYFQAVWVKNEWSRYLSLIRDGAQKVLIPAYKDMDPYDLPEEFSHLQAQDMGKLGFMQDLIRGITKIINKDSTHSVLTLDSLKSDVSISSFISVFKRGQMALEDGKWEQADLFFENTLNTNSEYAEAYLGKWLAKMKKRNLQEAIEYYKSKYMKADKIYLEACPSNEKHISEMVKTYRLDGWLNEKQIRNMYVYDRRYVSELKCRLKQKEDALNGMDSERYLARALQFANEDEKALIEGEINNIMQILDKRIEKATQDDKASIEKIRYSYQVFLTSVDNKLRAICNDINVARESRYLANIARFHSARKIKEFEEVIKEFEVLRNYKDSQSYIMMCGKKIYAKQLGGAWRSVIIKFCVIIFGYLFGWVILLIYLVSVCSSIIQ